MKKRNRPNKRKRKTRRKHAENAEIFGLITDYENQIKSTTIVEEIETLKNEIERLNILAKTGSRKERMEVTSILSGPQNIRTSMISKKSKASHWVSVYQSGATGLKK